MRAEVAKLVEKIPPAELAIQWDAALEMGDLAGQLPYLPREGAFERNVAQVGRLIPGIPESVMLGFHLCFGTLGGWPCFEPETLAMPVQFTNAIVAAAGRRVDFVHIPTLKRTHDEFFRPLGDLKVGRTRIYLGVIHDMEDLDGFRTRLRLSRKYLPEFGIAAPCGFGREPVARLPQIQRNHLKAVEILRAM